MNATDSKRSLPSWLPVAGGLVAAVLGMVLLWALFIAAGDEVGRDGPEVVDAEQLATVADQVGHPVYWAGERPDTKIEVAETDDGRVFVRYIGTDAEPGVRSKEFVTVATYPVSDAVAVLRQGAKERPGAELARGANGAVVLIDPSTPGNVRIAFPGADEQVELYSPNVEESIQLATDGTIQAVN